MGVWRKRMREVGDPGRCHIGQAFELKLPAVGRTSLGSNERKGFQGASTA